MNDTPASSKPMMPKGLLTFDHHVDFLNAYESGLQNHIADSYRSISDLGVFDNAKSVLSIGIGAGNLECLGAKEHGYRLSYIEPSPPMRKKLQENIRAHGIESLIGDEYHCLFEDFEPVDAYDLILSLDSWYRIGADKEMLEKALNLRSKGGKLLIQGLTRDKQIYWMLDDFRGLISSDELSQWATQNGFRHEYFTSTYRIPIENLIIDGELTDAYRNYAAFVYGKRWAELSAAEIDKARKVVIDLEKDGGIEKYFGHLLFTDVAS
jgi:SAM-dependent methyltransferase